MRYAALVGLCLLGPVMGSATAQERSLDEALQQINRVLQTGTFTDAEGQATTSQIKLERGGKLIVEVTRVKAGNRITNVFETSLGDVEPDEIGTRDRQGFTALTLGTKAPVKATLRCLMANGTVHEWDLPATTEMAIEFRADDAVKANLVVSLRQLIELARKDARYAVT